MRTKKVLVALGATAALLAPAAPASASTAADTCHYEPVSCACRIVVTILRDLTGDPWTCAN